MKGLIVDGQQFTQEIPLDMKMDLILCCTDVFKYKCPVCGITVVALSDGDMPLGHVECNCGVRHLVENSMVWN